MSQSLQKTAKFQKFQLDNLVDFEKCCQTRIYLQNFVLIQPKTSENVPKFCQKLTTRPRSPSCQRLRVDHAVAPAVLGEAQRAAERRRGPAAASAGVRAGPAAPYLEQSGLRGLGG